MPVVAGTYPALRPGRLGAIPTQALGAAPPATTSPPISRVFAFSIGASANTHSAKSSPLLRGPALITGLTYTKGNVGTGYQGVHLGKSQSSVALVSVANTTPLPYTALFEAMGAASALVPQLGGGAARVDMAQNQTSDMPALSIIVPEAQFYLVVGVASGLTGGHIFEGYVTVLEQVNPQALVNFL